MLPGRGSGVELQKMDGHPSISRIAGDVSGAWPFTFNQDVNNGNTSLLPAV